MDPYLVLARGSEVLALNGIAEHGEGIEAGPGATGLGHPPITVQWMEGAGDGATYRRRRVLPRDLDLPIQIYAPNRTGLGEWFSRLTTMLTEPCELRWMTGGGRYWMLPVALTGGGDWAYGTETGETWLTTTITLRAPDPWWTAAKADRIAFGHTEPAGTEQASGLHLRPPRFGKPLTVTNSGDAPAWPVWEITGPATRFTVALNGTDRFVWTGDLKTGEVLTIDTKAQTVTGPEGTSRYAELDPAPDLFPLPPGPSHLTVALEGATAGSRVVCWWRRRRWTVL